MPIGVLYLATYFTINMLRGLSRYNIGPELDFFTRSERKFWSLHHEMSLGSKPFHSVIVGAKGKLVSLNRASTAGHVDIECKKKILSE